MLYPFETNKTFISQLFLTINQTSCFDQPVSNDTDKLAEKVEPRPSCCECCEHI